MRKLLTPGRKYGKIDHAETYGRHLGSGIFYFSSPADLTKYFGARAPALSSMVAENPVPVALGLSNQKVSQSWRFFVYCNRSNKPMLDKETRRLVYNKTNGYCGYCGQWVEWKGKWDIEHMQPSSRCGSNNLANLVLACRKCNRQKHDKTMHEFRQSIMANLLEKLADIMDTIEKFGIRDLSDNSADYTSDILSDLMSAYHRLDPQHTLADEFDLRSPIIRFAMDGLREEEWFNLLREHDFDLIKATMAEDEPIYDMKALRAGSRR